MKRAVFLLLVAVSARADEVVQGLHNLSFIYSVATIMDTERAFGAPSSLPVMNDPWGTPYRVDFEGYRVISAGSDRKFDEASWTTSEQFTGTAGDVVFVNGRWVRTNHNWLCRRVNGGDAAAALAEMREYEFLFMFMRTPEMRPTLGARLTAMAVRRTAYAIEKGLSPEPIADAWGTPLRIEIEGDKYRIASAGSDRTFNPESWSQSTTVDMAGDLVFENGAWTREFDEQAWIKSKGVPTAEPVKQPPDARLQGTRLSALKDDQTATPPVAVERVEPVYPETHRSLRISGIVILEAQISETGAVGDVAVLKSVATAIDVAAVDALRKWTFKPAMRNGEPIPVLFNLTFNFKLN